MQRDNGYVRFFRRKSLQLHVTAFLIDDLKAHTF
jgi:hypothetical protein